MGKCLAFDFSLSLELRLGLNIGSRNDVCFLFLCSSGMGGNWLTSESTCSTDQPHPCHAITSNCRFGYRNTQKILTFFFLQFNCKSTCANTPGCGNSTKIKFLFLNFLTWRTQTKTGWCDFAGTEIIIAFLFDSFFWFSQPKYCRLWSLQRVKLCVILPTL